MALCVSGFVAACVRKAAASGDGGGDGGGEMNSGDAGVSALRFFFLVGGAAAARSDGSTISTASFLAIEPPVFFFSDLSLDTATAITGIAVALHSSSASDSSSLSLSSWTLPLYSFAVGDPADFRFAGDAARWLFARRSLSR